MTDELSLQCLWGKWGQPDDPSFHPLVCHMIDVGVVAEALLARVLPSSTRHLLQCGLGVTPQALSSQIAWLASIHDLGKASPAFQGLVENVWVPSLLQRAGLVAYDMTERPPHGRISGKSVRDILCRDWGFDRETAITVAAAVGGHHGLFPSASEVKSISELHDGGPSWDTIRGAITQAMATVFGVSADEKPTQCDSTTAVILAGLVAVADWIGSNTEFFRYAVAHADRPEPVDLAVYRDHAARQAVTALSGLGWNQLPHEALPLDFQHVFGFAPNALQEAALHVADVLPGPGLVIVEAPMGEGKTEAAQALADAVLHRHHLRGMFFAMPTQATSNQIFSRTSAFLAKRYPGDAVQLLLQH
ncbi:MAG: CRISPR-associated endonuclease Cas3'', partial [Candidatus Sericytochromatia bacterium]|nr:CRISPR-associated endonuclease Cas3'' [Candidatus Sericytochromatia bacterium]